MWRISIANDGTIVRGRAGDCSNQGRTQVHVFRGLTGRSIGSGLDVASALHVDAASSSAIVVLAADVDCNARAYTSTDMGKNWQPGEPVDAWYLDPEDDEVVQTPGGPSRPGCEGIEVHPIDDDLARVTCADGLIIGTADGGEQWVRLGELEGAHATVFTGPSNAVSLAPVSGCGAQALLTRDGGRTWESGGCISSEGIEGIASNGATLVAQVGGELYSSSDNAESWTQP
jgi:hypothetical protein